MNSIMILDINECENPKACDENATCEDKPGTFVCKCNKGYRGSGFKCDGKQINA